MENTLDLSRYRVTRMPEGAGAGFKQILLLHPSTSLPIYTVYHEAASAQAEVTYARLAKKLKLPNVMAVYGENLHIPDAPACVSVSNYGYRDWIPYKAWLAHSNLYPSLRNPEAVSLHEVLGHLIQSEYWHNDGAGYVYPDGRFAKANNGGAFFAFGLAQMLSGSIASDIFFRELSAGRILSDYDITGSIQRMLERLGGLTEADLAACVKTPAGLDDEGEGRGYFLSRLRHARYVASKCVDALAERKMFRDSGEFALA